MYLCHFVFVQVGYDLIYPNIPLPAVFKIILIAAFTFAVALGIVWLLSLNRVTRKVVM
ncbi:hypothetical protein GCM10023143_30060 [Compostibacter hankyongensis]|uniref:Acyltransferase n=1 Tax=Compostibacter hankyongensis TaxID=1007089 RepID=A0ABP8G596_9BACT